MLKYTTHMAALPMKQLAKAASVAAFQGRPARVWPVIRIDSPSAMMMNNPQRSAMWPPSTFQSAVVERPRPGTRKPISGETVSIASASPHTAIRASGGTKPPAIQQAAPAPRQIVMRTKLR